GDSVDGRRVVRHQSLARRVEGGCWLSRLMASYGEYRPFTGNLATSGDGRSGAIVPSMHVQIALFDGFDPLDVVGPYEVLWAGGLLSDGAVTVELASAEGAREV